MTIGIPVANSVRRGMEIAMACNQRLSSSTGHVIPAALFWQCNIGSLCTRVGRVSRTRSDQELRYSIPPLAHSRTAISPRTTFARAGGHGDDIGIVYVRIPNSPLAVWSKSNCFKTAFNRHKTRCEEESAARDAQKSVRLWTSLQPTGSVNGSAPREVVRNLKGPARSEPLPDTKISIGLESIKGLRCGIYLIVISAAWKGG
jgi:hypothetical protein